MIIFLVLWVKLAFHQTRRSWRPRPARAELPFGRKARGFR